MQTAIKIDFNGGQVEMRPFDASRLRTTGMTFRCMCNKPVRLYRRSGGLEFVHNVRNPACTYPRRTRVTSASAWPTLRRPRQKKIRF